MLYIHVKHLRPKLGQFRITNRPLISTSDVDPDPDPHQIGLPDPGGKKSAKSWETRIKMDRNHHNIIILNIEITLLYT